MLAAGVPLGVYGRELTMATPLRDYYCADSGSDELLYNGRKRRHGWFLLSEANQLLALAVYLL